MSARRMAAGASLLAGALTVAWAGFVLARNWPVDGAPPLLLLFAGALAWWGVRRRAGRRLVALVI